MYPYKVCKICKVHFLDLSFSAGSSGSNVLFTIIGSGLIAEDFAQENHFTRSLKKKRQFEVKDVLLYRTLQANRLMYKGLSKVLAIVSSLH